MTFNPEDPKWTAYILGELDAPGKAAEKAAIERELESSEEARAFVEEMRIAAGALELELKAEFKASVAASPDNLSQAQREAVEAAALQAAAAPASNVRVFNSTRNWLGGLAVAAMILLAVFMPSMWRKSQLTDSGQRSVIANNAKPKGGEELKMESNPVSVAPAPAAQTATQKAGESSAKADNKAATAEPTSPPSSVMQSIQVKEEAVSAGVSGAVANLPVTNPADLSSLQPPQQQAALSNPAGAGGGARGGAGGRGAGAPGGAGGGARGGGPAGASAAVARGVGVNGSIGGVIQDSTKALIPGVAVTATNNAIGMATTVYSNDSGAFLFNNLAPGTYTLQAALTGFRLAQVLNIKLESAEIQRVDIAMLIGNMGDRVTVKIEDSAATVHETSSSVGEIAQADSVRTLPLVGGNVLDLLTVMPGFRESAVGGQFDKVGGLGLDTVNTTINGMTTNSSRNSAETFGFQVFTPNVVNPDLVGEVRLADAGVGRGNAQTAQAQQGQQGQGQSGGQGQQGQASAAGRGGPAGAGGARGAAGGGGRGGAPAAAAAPPPPPPPVAAPRAAPATPAPVSVLRSDSFGIFDDARRNQPGTASYAPIIDNPFVRVGQEPVSTFSSDVDTASYANIRRFLNQNQLPPPNAVRIEEMINYFTYDYAQPTGRDPIGAQMEVASAPWAPSHRLVRVAVKARDIDANKRPASNLVFLIDVSGSMQPSERLPLIKSALGMLVNNLTESDHVSIVVYAGASGVVLPSTTGDRKPVILQSLDRLAAGGSTNGAAGIQLAYQIATSNFIQGGVNRVILATDGDFNVGVTNQTELTRIIQERAKSGVFLSVLGVGTDNLQDSTMERLADMGNGTYAYLDSLNEAYRVMVQQMSGTLITVAKDVKLQVEFNPNVVEAYRLIGYENRVMATADFNNDRKDAGDMGAGHGVTALYEIVPRGGSIPGPNVDPLKYQPAAPAPAAAATAKAAANNSKEMLTLKIRYKQPTASESTLLEFPLTDRETQFAKASADFRFAAAVAEFGMLLRNSPYAGNASIADVLENAQSGKGQDRNGYRQEFIQLVQKARTLSGRF